ncbi:MAG TPA: hypothetical protein GX697_06170, partial [Firmicutes bacterium]|nr:hypothetical protein [Bacillota bacterium]
MFKSIRAKLTFTYIAIVLSAIALISVFLLSIMGKYYQDYNRESMAKAGSLVAEFSVDYLKRGADTVALSVLAEDMSRQINAR